MGNDVFEAPFVKQDIGATSRGKPMQGFQHPGTDFDKTG
jgi:hypothetical protein